MFRIKAKDLYKQIYSGNYDQYDKIDKRDMLLEVIALALLEIDEEIKYANRPR